MTLAYPLIKHDIAGTMHKKIFNVTGATLGTAGNAIITGLKRVLGVYITGMGTATTTEAPTFAISGGTVTVYAVIATFQLAVEGF